jgi:hypothetical protein
LQGMKYCFWMTGVVPVFNSTTTVGIFWARPGGYLHPIHLGSWREAQGSQETFPQGHRVTILLLVQP